MSILASGGACIKFHDWPSGIYLGSVQVNDYNLCIQKLSWCNQGHKLVAVPNDGKPLIIKPLDNIISNSSNLGEVSYQRLDIERVNVVDFSKAVNSNLAVGGPNGQIYIYDIEEESIVTIFPSLRHDVKFLSYSAKDVLLAAGSYQGQLVLYNSQNSVCASLAVPSSYSLSAMNFHPQYSSMLAGASKEGVVVVWNTENSHTILSGKYHTNIVTDVAFSTCCRNVFASVGLDHKFICHDIRMPEHTEIQYLEYELAAVAFMPNRSEMAVASVNGHLICYDRRKLQMPLSTMVSHNKPIKNISFQSEGLKEIRDESRWTMETYTVNSYVEDDTASLSIDCGSLGDSAEVEFNKSRGDMELLGNLEAGESRADSVKEDENDIKQQILAEIENECRKFEDYMNECFFEMKIAISKRFIAMDESFQRKKQLLVGLLRNKGDSGGMRLKKTASSQIRPATGNHHKRRGNSMMDLYEK